MTKQDSIDTEITFETFGFNDNILRGVQEAGFKVPSPIQKESIPIVLQGKDVIAQAQTGTGKTAAFGLPAMNQMKFNKGVEILVITPTRELAAQVSEEMFKLGRFTGVKTVAVYGGQSISRQVSLVSRGAQVVVATPGRLLDQLGSGRFRNFNPSMVILDEADEMLDMGFIDDIREIFKFLPEKRQTLLFSATMPTAIRRLAKDVLNNPVSVKIQSKETTNTDIEQLYYVIENHERTDAVIRLIDSEEPEKTLIFCRTKKETDALNTTLIARGYSANALHGDMGQSQRQETVGKFKSGKVDIVVATDVAARGLDITGVSHVFNYHIPLAPDSYVHRIGRTGRAGEKGKAITLVTPLEFKELRTILNVTKASIAHSEIPTIKDIKKKYYPKMLKEIKQQHLHEDAAEIIQSLEEEMDLTSIAYKLVSMVVKNQSISGPEHIGKSGKQLQIIIQRLLNRSYPEKSGNSKYRYKSRYGNKPHARRSGASTNKPGSGSGNYKPGTRRKK